MSDANASGVPSSVNARSSGCLCDGVLQAPCSRLGDATMWDVVHVKELVVDVMVDLRRWRRRLVLLAVERHRKWALVGTPLWRYHSGLERHRMVHSVFAKLTEGCAGAARRDCMISCRRMERF